MKKKVLKPIINQLQNKRIFLYILSFFVFLIVSFLPFQKLEKGPFSFSSSLTTIPIAHAEIGAELVITFTPMDSNEETVIRRDYRVFKDQQELDTYLKDNPSWTLASQKDLGSQDEANNWKQEQNKKEDERYKQIRDSYSQQSIYGWLAERLFRAIMFAIFALLWLFYWISYSLVSASQWILQIFFNPEFTYSLGGFTKESFVVEAAKQVVNLCNMLYIVFLLYIVVKSYLGSSDTYRLLIKLALAALLTNFALVISGVIIDVSQVTMYSIIKPEQKITIGTKIIDDMQSSILKNESEPGTNSISWEETADLFFSRPLGEVLGKTLHVIELLMLTFAMVVTLLTITLILVIRIAALWILLILSPIAITFSAFPPTEKYWREWLDTFTKYAFTGPILVFFLWLGGKASETINSLSLQNGSLQKFVQSQSIAQTGNLKDEFYLFIVNNFPITFRFFVVIIIIWAGIIIANKFGIKGAKSLDGLMKSTGNLGGAFLKGAAGISRVPLWLEWKRLKLSSNEYSNKERVASLEAEKLREMGEPQEIIDAKQAEADKYKAAKDNRNAQTRRVLAVIGFSSPKIMKSALGKWWKESNEEYFNYSEGSMKHYFSRFLDHSLGRKNTDITIIGEKAIKDSYDLANQATKKATTLRKKYAEIETKKKNGQDVTEEEKEAKTLSDELDMLIDRFASRTSNNEQERAVIRARVKESLIKRRINSPTLNSSIDSMVDTVVQNNDLNEEEKISLLNLLEGDIAEAISQGDAKFLWTTFDNLGSQITASSGNLGTGDTYKLNKETRKLQRMLLSGTRENPVLAANLSTITTTEDPIRQSYKNGLVRSASISLGKNLTNQARDIAIADKKKDLSTTYIWQIKKTEEKISEAKKGQEAERLSLEQMADIVASGQRNQTEQIAALRTLSGSAKHFGDMVKKLADSHGGIDGARNFLLKRFSEKEVMEAFRMAETDARKNHNLYGIGHVVYDPLTGKSQFTSEQQRSSIVKKTITGWDSRELNQIHAQSFENPEDVHALAQTMQWKFLSENRAFVKGMKDSVASLLRKHSDTIIDTIKDAYKHDPAKQTEVVEAFEKVRDRKDPEPPRKQKNP